MAGIECPRCACVAPDGAAECAVCGSALPRPAQSAHHAGDLAPLAVLALVLFALVVLTLLAH